MNLTILGASGATGNQLVRQALMRGHHVTAVARTIARIEAADSDRLTRVAADVLDADATADALAGSTTILSGLGVASGESAGALTLGARAAVASGAERIIWLGALGTGGSAVTASRFTTGLLRLALSAELPDKHASEQLVLDAGGTVVHAGMLTNGPLVPTRRVPVAAVPRRVFPTRISRASVAAAMLDEAEDREHPSSVVAVLGC